MSQTAFDSVAADLAAEYLKLSSTEDIGREAARRVDKFTEMARDAREQSDTSEDLILLAGAASTADYSAAMASTWLDVVVALLGQGDTAALTRATRQAQTARTHAAMATRRWMNAKQKKGVGAV